MDKVYFSHYTPHNDIILFNKPGVFKVGGIIVYCSYLDLIHRKNAIDVTTYTFSDIRHAENIWNMCGSINITTSKILFNIRVCIQELYGQTAEQFYKERIYHDSQ